MFLDIGEVAFCRGCPLCTSRILPSHHSGQESVGPRVGSDLCLQTQFHRFHDRCLLVSGVCPLVGEAGSQLSVGRAMSSGSFSVD